MIVQHVFFHDLPTKDGDVGFWSGHAIAPSGFYHAWCRARIAAGCPGSIPHDFRRTAIRSMFGLAFRSAWPRNWTATRLAACSIAIMSSAMETSGTLRVGLGTLVGTPALP